MTVFQHSEALQGILDNTPSSAPSTTFFKVALSLPKSIKWPPEKKRHPVQYYMRSKGSVDGLSDISWLNNKGERGKLKRK